MGVRNPEALSLCDVAWVGAAASDGVRWYSPVQAAMVEGAVSENGPPRKVDDKIFDAPLRIRLDDLPKPPGTAWHLLNPKRGDPGSLEVALPPLMAAAWLFVSESMDPGWTAEVRTLKSTWMPAQLVASEGSFMAVHLEQPDAQVRLRYSPPGLGLGLMLALLGFLAFFATLFRSFAR